MTIDRDIGLTIGELAHRTGLTPATLRAWESRHGFPRPERRPSGHRRYSEKDATVIAEVLRAKAAGVRLETAIAEAVAVQRAPTSSIFAELRRRHAHLAVQPLRKRTLLALTRAVEDECCARAEQPTLFAAFQHARYFEQSRSRWVELARTSRHTVVFADLGEKEPVEPADQVTFVHLSSESPMRREWSLVCDADDRPAALAAWELPGQSGTSDRERVFEAIWTVEPPAVRDAARACAKLAGRLSPQLWGSFDHLEAPLPPASEDLRSAGGLFERLVGYVDRTS